jgi:hypothetical protein
MAAGRRTDSDWRDDAGQATHPVVPIQAPTDHPRRAGFRDGFLAAVLLVLLGFASGLLVVRLDGPRSPSGALPDQSVPGSPVGAVPSTSIGASPAASLAIPPVLPLTLVFVPNHRLPAGTEMVGGCGFEFDLGTAQGARTWRTCPGAEGPTGPLGVLRADPGAHVLIENSGFTPSVRPSSPAVACGQLIGKPPAFVEVPSCRPGYAAGTSYAFGFSLPDDRGRWVIAVRGCLPGPVTACGAWYAEVDTTGAPAAA